MAYYRIGVDVSQLEALARKFPGVKWIVNRAERRTLELIMQMLLNLAVDITHRKELSNTGAYVTSLGTEVRGTPTNFRGILTPAARHGYFVEHGRKPGKMPPRDAIELWVKRKLGITNQRDVESVAYLVRRAIGAKGTIKRFGYKGGEVLADTVKQGRPKIQKMWADMGTWLDAQITQQLSQ